MVQGSTEFPMATAREAAGDGQDRRAEGKREEKGLEVMHMFKYKGRWVLKGVEGLRGRGRGRGTNSIPLDHDDEVVDEGKE